MDEVSPSPWLPSAEIHLPQENRILAIDKPQGWTSFDVVNKIRGALRRQLGRKQIKVGHSGTLDPMATGLLLLGTGKCTRELAALQELGKEYEGSLRFGISTPSYDTDTAVNGQYPWEHITEAKIREALETFFFGEIWQVPPIYSAIKVGGQPLYKKARRGETFEPPPRRVVIYNWEILRMELPDMDFRIACSKGTYIRSLAHDLGRHLGSGACLHRLVRTRIGAYSLTGAQTPQAFIQSLGIHPSNSGS